MLVPLQSLQPLVLHQAVVFHETNPLRRLAALRRLLCPLRPIVLLRVAVLLYMAALCPARLRLTDRGQAHLYSAPRYVARVATEDSPGTHVGGGLLGVWIS